MNFRNFEMTSITGYVEVPSVNSMGINMRDVGHASNFVRHLKKHLHSIRDASVSVEETTATIDIVARPTVWDPHGLILGRTVASYYSQFTG
jgi:hypothetical protein